MHDRYPKHVRFLVHQPKFHLLLRTSQRSDFPRRIRSRVTHGTRPALEFHQEAWFLLPGKTKERRTLMQRGSTFATGPLPANHRNAIQFSRYYSPILTHQEKSG